MKKPQSPLEAILQNRIERAGLPAPLWQVEGIIPGRKFCFDAAYVDERLTIECEGGTWSKKKMGHNSGTGIRRDCEKANLGQLAGWLCLRFTADMIEDGTATRLIAIALKRADGL